MYIYQIKNLINNKIYIGSTNNLYNRKQTHFSNLRSNKHENSFIQNSFNKYGEDNFEFSIIATVIDVTRDELYEIESDYRDKLNCYAPNGYNINKSVLGPPSNKGKIKSEEHRLKISKSLENHIVSLETRKKISLPITNLINSSPEYKEKISIPFKKSIGNRKGKLHSEETKKKISESRMGRKAWNKGKIGCYIRSEDAKIKCSNSLKNHSVSEETRQKISNSLMNHSFNGNQWKN